MKNIEETWNVLNDDCKQLRYHSTGNIIKRANGRQDKEETVGDRNLPNSYRKLIPRPTYFFSLYEFFCGVSLGERYWKKWS